MDALSGLTLHFIKTRSFRFRLVVQCAFAAIVFLAIGGLATGAPSPAPNSSEAAKLNQQIGQLRKAGKYSEALPYAAKLLELCEKTVGPQHPNTAGSLKWLALLYEDMRDYAKAEPLFQRALKIEEKALGPEHPDTATTLDDLATLYRDMYDYPKAEPLFKRALKIREKTLGPERPLTALSLDHLANLYRLMEEYPRAELLSERALEIEEKNGPDHPETARALNNLALVYDNKGDYAKAEPLYQRALKIREKALGPEHPYTAESLGNLAVLYGSMGDYAKAVPLLKRALNIGEKALGPEHPRVALGLQALGLLYEEMGDYAKAEPLTQRALKIEEKALGPEHPATATSLNNLGMLYQEMGDYAKAEPLYQRALSIREKVLGPEHPATATSLLNLGYLYYHMGDYARTEPLYQRVLTIREKVLGPEHPHTALILSNLADLYSSMGDYAKAEPLYQRALKIREKVLGPDHPRTAVSLNNLGLLYEQMGDYAKAEPLLQRALKIREKVLGPEHPRTATSLKDLARLYRKMGYYAKAEPLLQRALKIFEKALGPDHPDTARALNSLAYLYAGMGNPQEAFRLETQARLAYEKFLSDILSFTSEQQRLAFQKTISPYDLPGTLGNASELAERVLRLKGLVLDSLLEDRLIAENSGDPKQREIIEHLRAAKQRLTQLQEIPENLSAQAQKQREAEKGKLSTEVEQLEGGLARQVAGLGKARRALSVTVAQVQSALAQQAVLIELLRYSHYLGKDKEEPRYGAVVIGANGEPGWVPLGNAAEIEKNVELYQKSVRGKTDQATLSSILRTLDNQVWAPIEKALPAGTTTVIVSPDAELSFVSFATLLTADDRFVGEEYSVRYVASGRDLLRETKPTAGPKTTMRVFANPDFGGIAAAQHVDQKNVVALRSVEMRDLQGISLPSLPGTEKEAAELETRAKKANWQPQTYLGPNATKAELEKVNSPRILHLATHGFFLPEIDLGKAADLLQSGEEIPKGKLVNPMHRSGLALAGAQRTLQAWAKGEVPPIQNDGIVTAENVGGLKLDDTWLVVLSACDTGSGEARAGEGVMGLRRGFVQAGAQNLLMTLWPISDETTVQIMLDFYDAAFKSGNAPQALADTQRDWLVRLRKERGLPQAVRLAGPFIMSSQGKL